MTDPGEVVADMCRRYQQAVNANDSEAYGRLFSPDSIRVPPGSAPEHGPEEIVRSEQSDYDDAHWTIASRAVDALEITPDWVYGIAHVEVTTVAHDDGSTRSFEATKTWLLHRNSAGEWRIERQMWNLR